MARACKTCFENLRENVDVSHSETLRMLNKKLTRFPQSLSLETKGYASGVAEPLPDPVTMAYYSFQWRKSALFQSCQKYQKGFSFGLLITLTAIRNDFHPQKKYEKLRTC